MSVVLKIQQISSNAKVPSKGSDLSAGLDLYSAHDCKILPHDKQVVDTDIRVQIPPGCYGRIAPRSGLTISHFLDVGAGVIDPDYRGNLKVVLFNFGSEPVSIRKGNKIAQLILERIWQADIKVVDCLDSSKRGARGFGSSGSK